MAEKERTILDMRAAGRQYKEISAEPGIDVSALKVFVHRQKKPGARKCAMCGKRLPDKARASQRFCSIKCKNAWWKKHPNQDGNDKRVVRACSSCGSQFISCNPNSEYCSRDCYYVENLLGLAQLGEAEPGHAGPIEVWNEQAWRLPVAQVTVHSDGSAEFLFRGENLITVK